MLKLCKKYMPETKEAKKARLLEMAQQKKVQLLKKNIGRDGGVKTSKDRGCLGEVFSYRSRTLSLSSSVLAFDHFKNFPRVSSEIHPTTQRKVYI